MTLRTLMPRTRLEWVEKLAGAGMWIAIGAFSYVVSTRPEWKWAAVGCIMTLAVVSAAAGIPRRLAGRRLVFRKGSGLSGRGRDDDGGLGGESSRCRGVTGLLQEKLDAELNPVACLGRGEADAGAE